MSRLIEYRKGCLIEAFKNGEIDILAHGVNCQGVMGSGVAKLVKQEFPEVFERYQSRAEAFLPDELLGDAQPVRIGARQVYNLFTQVTYGRGKRQVNYAALVGAFDTMLWAAGKLTIGIPKIGAGLGGGDWSIIEQLIEDTASLTDFKGKVICYEI